MKGGGSIHIIVNTLFLLNGNINISGGTPPLSSSAGGGAAGSIFIESRKGLFIGTGVIEILGMLSCYFYL